MDIEIKQLFIYPIKSIPGISVDSIELTMAGPKHDRQYMLVDENKRFVTQRTHPLLSQFSIQQTAEGWSVASKDGSTISFDDAESSDSVFQTKVWKHSIQVREKSNKVSQWFSEHLDQLIKLVEFEELETRHKEVQGHLSPLQFADGYPLLLCNQQSLEMLSMAVDQPLSMSRFRPNIVVSIKAEAEYDFSVLSRHDGAEILVGKPCERCNIPAIDPVTGVFNRGLHLLFRAELERQGKAVFGVNAAINKAKRLSVGDVFNAL